MAYFDEYCGICASVTLFQDTNFGCCTDGVTPAGGPNGEGCPVVFGCEATVFGCCPDGLSPANGENYAGCQVPEKCLSSKFGCCPDGVTTAIGELGYISLY